MDTNENILDIGLKVIEYCYLYEDQAYDNKTFKIKIPKIMSRLIPEKDTSYNKNIFINAGSCKPAPKTVKLQSYITVPKLDRCSLEPIATSDDNPVVKENTCVLCLCMNGNIKDMTIVDYKN